MNRIRRRIMVSALGAIMLMGLLAGCGKKDIADVESAGGKSEITDIKASSQYSNVGMTADDVIKAAEKTSITSGDASDAGLYTVNPGPFTEMDIFLQKHSEGEIQTYDWDAKFFTPVGTDYFYGEFTKGTTFLYSYDITGTPVDVKGRIVYDSVDELKSANSDKNLTEDSYNDEGYTYHGRVLYYQMPGEGVFAVSNKISKENMLRTAAKGFWDGDSVVYYFSKPYMDMGDGEYSYSDIPEAEGLGDNPDVEVDKSLTEADVYDLFTGMMKAKDMTLEEYRKFFTKDVADSLVSQYYNVDYADASTYQCCDVIITAQVDGLAYAAIQLYTVPEDYKLGDKIQNYIFASIIGLDPEDGTWKCAQCDANWNALQDEYYYQILSDGGYDAAVNGRFFKRLWIPFDLDQPFMYNGAMYAKILEVYADAYGDLMVTVYLANGTDEDVSVNSIEELSLECEKGTLLEVGCNLYKTVPAGDYRYEILQIPAEYLQFDSFSEIYEGRLVLDLK